MAHYFAPKERRVLPSFRSFVETIELGELRDARSAIPRPLVISIDNNIIAWHRHRTIGTAGDLVGSALVAAVKDSVPVVEAAEFVLSNSALASPSQLALAERVLGLNNLKSINESLPHIRDFLKTNTKHVLYDRIRDLKAAAIRFSRDPILFVELARLYSVLGQEEQAKRNMRIAVSLAPENRYVLRSFVRLFAHFDDAEYAYSVIRRSPAAKLDPWLLSAEMSLSVMLGRENNLFKRGLELVKSENFSPFSTAELASALGTIEFLAGSRSKSKNLLRQALSDPNDNALAQVEWVLTQEKLFTLEVTQFDVKRNFEASALEAFYNQEWNKTLEFAERWFLDMPFSKRPIMLGSLVSSVVLDDQKTAEIFCRAGLSSHPGNSQLINNLAYSLALDNKVIEAANLLDAVNVPGESDPTNKICLIATQGLIAFRQGNLDLGRNLYRSAIEASERISSKRLRKLALLNYAREEVIVGGTQAEELISEVRQLDFDTQEAVLHILCERVLKLYDQRKK
jgi:tetratricopeptide (TPR) repeat protein